MQRLANHFKVQALLIDCLRFIQFRYVDLAMQRCRNHRIHLYIHRNIYDAIRFKVIEFDWDVDDCTPFIPHIRIVLFEYEELIVLSKAKTTTEIR